MERIDPLAGDAWDNAVLAHEDHTIFHRSAWARVLSETYGHRPFYLHFPETGTVVPLMEIRSPLTGCRGVSLPFSDFAGPLWSETTATEEIFRQLAGIADSRKWKWLEIRDDRISPPAATPCVTYETHQLDLRPGTDALERNLAPAVCRALRKAGRESLVVTMETSSRAVADFYSLHTRTRRRHGLPPQPDTFFRSIGRNLVERGLGFVVLARLAGSPVAGALFLRSGRHAIYKFGASDTAAWHLRPNQPVMWEAIRHLAETGCHFLNFGRTATSDDGLRRFKLSWGCSSRPLSYFRYCAGTWKSPLREPKESHPFLFSRLPLMLNRLAGKLIYPHLD